MYSKITLAILGTAVVLSLIGTVNAPMGNTVFASTENDKNDFGEAARGLAQSEDTTDPDDPPSSEMGEHSSNPPFELDPDPGREGIGNVGEFLCGERLHPSETARVLGGGDCPDDDDE